MEKLRAKLKKQGGFTLVEMLIVVAIIAILIAVSIPLVGSALEKAREATDAANERGFKASLVSGHLLYQAGMSDGIEVKASTDTETHVYSYDAVNGKVSDTAITPGYGKSKDVEKNTLYGIVDEKGTVTLQWGPAGTMLGKDAIKGDNLLSTELIAPTP